ncbi:hypothetical protein WJX74_002707 [Apatococcus lobatus]
MTKRKEVYGLQSDTDEERFSKFKQSKKELNQSFLSWAQQQFFSHPDGNWDEGTVQYLRRSKQLAADLLKDSNHKDSSLPAEGGSGHRKLSNVPQSAAAVNGGSLTFGASSSAAPSFSFGASGFGGTTSSAGGSPGTTAAAPLFGTGSSLFGSSSSAAAPSRSDAQPSTGGGLSLFGTSAASFSQPAAPLSFNFGGAPRPSTSSSAPDDCKPALPAFSFPSSGTAQHSFPSSAMPSTSG